MSSPPNTDRRPITLMKLGEMRALGEPIVMVTAYDHPFARLADSAGVDVILVGDSLGMVVLGYDSTLPVTMPDMLHHTRAVMRARPPAPSSPICRSCRSRCRRASRCATPGACCKKAVPKR